VVSAGNGESNAALQHRGAPGFRHLSPSIVLKRNNLAVDLTVSSLYA
jgi:hypothetical protein